MSIQIVEKSGDGLSRVFGVTVSAKELSQRAERRIAEITPQLSLKGFRPGKVPPAHVKRLYGKSIMSEVVEQTVNESTQQAIDDAKVRPATQPEMKLESDMDKVLAGQQDLAYEIQLEVMPDFKPVDPASIELTRPVYKATDEEVDEAVDELAKQQRAYEPKTGKAVKAADGDMVVADFVGRIDGEAFEGGTASDSQIILGSGQFIPGFEEQLVGAKVGDVVTVKVSFPEEYGAAQLAGKPAEFETTIKDIRAPAESKVDEDFATKLGMPSLEALKDAVRGQVEQTYANQSRFKLKRALLDALDSAHDFPLPPRMVEAEFGQIWSQVQADKAQGSLPDEDVAKSEDELQADYRKIAERRVRLGLVLAEIGALNNVTISDEELTNAARQEAMRYGPQAQEVFDYLRRTPAAQAQLRAPLYEDKVVDLLFRLAKVEDKPVSKDELMADDELPEGYGSAEENKPVKKAAPKKAKAEVAKDEAAEPAAEEAKPAKAKAKKAETAEDAPAAEEAAPKKAAKPKAKKAD
ncbi:MAG TPA: trigger factor [Caulobacteraceae bacterium]|jgi:trigger factor|nr:trigger factor [Caulobacteraceae bacterium]